MDTLEELLDELHHFTGLAEKGSTVRNELLGTLRQAFTLGATSVLNEIEEGYQDPGDNGLYIGIPTKDWLTLNSRFNRTKELTKGEHG